MFGQAKHSHVLKGQYGLICVHVQKYVTKTILLFKDNLVLIQTYLNVFITRIYITICELLIYYILIGIQTDDTCIVLKMLL